MLAANCAYRNIPHRLYEGDDPNEKLWLRAVLKVFEDAEAEDDEPEFRL